MQYNVMDVCTSYIALFLQRHTMYSNYTTKSLKMNQKLKPNECPKNIYKKNWGIGQKLTHSQAILY